VELLLTLHYRGSMPEQNIIVVVELLLTLHYRRSMPEQNIIVVVELIPSLLTLHCRRSF
jgi:hypothetical protein